MDFGLTNIQRDFGYFVSLDDVILCLTNYLHISDRVNNSMFTDTGFREQA